MLPVWEVPQEAMDIQRQTPGRFDQDSLETRPMAMNLIYQMVYAQPGLVPQITGGLTHSRFWAATVFVDHYFDYFYAQLIRGTSYE